MDWLTWRNEKEVYHSCLDIADEFPSEEFEQLQAHWLGPHEIEVDKRTRTGGTRKKKIRVDPRLIFYYSSANNIYS